MKRTAFQGVSNVIRFNWPFYALAICALIALGVGGAVVSGPLRTVAFALLAVAVVLIATSLLVTYWVYDGSNLYSLDWLDGIVGSRQRILNINAGFDETSELLAQKFPDADLRVADFYDPARHTEPSIARARRAYPPFPGTVTVSANSLPYDHESIDVVLLMMAAHEIRNPDERGSFFAELRRIIAADGRVVVVEHVRGLANWLAYNIGALHFHNRAAWERSFATGGLAIDHECSITPFVTVFYLKRNGT